MKSILRNNKQTLKKIQILVHKCYLPWSKYSFTTIFINPLLPIVAFATQGQKLDFNLRRDHQKISYERPDYESLDEKNLSLTKSRKLTKIRIQAQMN